jgi:hypothetical protein
MTSSFFDFIFVKLREISINLAIFNPLKKYMQFNGMNRLNKLNRYGSTENLNNNRYNSELKSFRNLNINNIDREMEKNVEDLEYPLLKNYFHA